MTPLAPPATLGVIGGGQLGRMFLQAAQSLGYRTIVLSPTADSPAAQIAHETIVAPTDSFPALKQLAEKAHAVTVEFENVSAAGLRWIERKRPTRPGWRTVWVSQNRLREKAFLARHGFPLAPWQPVRSEAELEAAASILHFPLILKTAASGYDGKGQVRVGDADSLLHAWSSLNRVSCVAEAVVSFVAECSVVVARGEGGRAVAYPVCLNRHKKHILDATVCPAPVGPVVSSEARHMALAVAQALGTVGVLTVEFFLTEQGHLAINEIAPRPHNSGHLTIEAAVSSQFEQQVRTLCALPLGSSDLISPAAMVNLLGDLWSKGEPKWAAAMDADPGVKLHLYAKRSAAVGRKMGHLTVLDADPDQALARAEFARRVLSS